jgi:hypothetical protein
VINGKVKDSEHRLIFARARTWLNDTMLELTQTPLKPAPTPQSTVATMLLRLAREAPRQAATPSADAGAMISTASSNFPSRWKVPSGHLAGVARH